MKINKNYLLISIIVHLLTNCCYLTNASENVNKDLDHLKTIETLSIDTTTTTSELITINNDEEVITDLPKYNEEFKNVKRKTSILSHEEFEYLQSSLKNIKNLKCKRILIQLYGV